MVMCFTGRHFLACMISVILFTLSVEWRGRQHWTVSGALCIGASRISRRPFAPKLPPTIREQSSDPLLPQSKFWHRPRLVG